MPIPIVSKVFGDGLDSVPWVLPLLKTAPGLAVLYLVKAYFSGASNGSERSMHGKVVMVTV